jgi:hypothetical protein
MPPPPHPEATAFSVHLMIPSKEHHVQIKPGIAQAVRRFRDRVANSYVIRFGQHVWGTLYRQCVSARLEAAYAATEREHVLAVRRAISTYRGADDERRETARKNLAALLDRVPHAEASKVVRRMMNDAGPGAKRVTDTAWLTYVTGSAELDTVAKFDQFLREQRLDVTFATADAMGARGGWECANTANQVAARINRLPGGLWGFTSRRHPGQVGPLAVGYADETAEEKGRFTFSTVSDVDAVNARRVTGTTWGTLLRYSATLPSLVLQMKKALDAGYLLNTYLLSGWRADKPLKDPDHFVLIIGYEGDRFCYWDTYTHDTHALVSNPVFDSAGAINAGEPFGIFYWVDGPTAVRGTALLDARGEAFFRHGRLSTASDERWLRLLGKGSYTPAKGYYHADKDADISDWAGREKRYQVLQAVVV